MIQYSGPSTANIMVIGDCVRDIDVRSNKFFQGGAGDVLDKLSREAGFSRHDVILTTICRIRPPGGKIGFYFEDKKWEEPREYFIKALHETKLLIANLRPNIIIAVGNIATRYLCGVSGIEANRGYIHECVLVPGIKVLPVYDFTTIDMEWRYFFTSVMDFRKAVINSRTPGMPKDLRILRTECSYSTIIEYLDDIMNNYDEIALDIETVSPGPHIDIIGLAKSPFDAISIQIVKDKKPVFTAEAETEIWRMIALICKNKTVIMQNGKYDMTVLWDTLGILTEKYTKDIMLAAHAAWPETPRSLGYLASVCLNVPTWKNTAASDPCKYNAADGANTFGIWQVMEKELVKTNSRHVHDFEIRQSPIASMMELQGIKIDREKQKLLVQDNTSKAAELEQEIYSLIGKEINLNSPAQLSKFLYEELKLPKQYKRDRVTNENKLTTGADALITLHRVTGNEALKKILDYKKTVKLLTFLDCTVSPNNTVHTCYNITGANMAYEKKGRVVDEDDSFKSFGRWSSSESIIKSYGPGNLQNIPPKAREMFDAGEGKVFLQADYKQAEAVVVAYLINDQSLIKLFKASFGVSDADCKRRNLDVHKITAANMAGMAVEYVIAKETGELVVIFSGEVTGEMRKVGKTIRHAKNYSAGPDVLARKLGIPLIAAKQLMQKYDLANPQLKLWQMEIVKELARTRILTNVLGRPHKFLGRWGDSLFRSAYSFIPQSSVGDLLNKALEILYYEFGGEVEIAIQLHDAIYIIIDDNPEAIERGKWILRHCMVDRTQPLTVNGQQFSIDIDFKCARYWGDLHD